MHVEYKCQQVSKQNCTKLPIINLSIKYCSCTWWLSLINQIQYMQVTLANWWCQKTKNKSMVYPSNDNLNQTTAQNTDFNIAFFFITWTSQITCTFLAENFYDKEFANTCTISNSVKRLFFIIPVELCIPDCSFNSYGIVLNCTVPVHLTLHVQTLYMYLFRSYNM